MPVRKVSGVIHAATENDQVFAGRSHNSLTAIIAPCLGFGVRLCVAHAGNPVPVAGPTIRRQRSGKPASLR